MPWSMHGADVAQINRGLLAVDAAHMHRCDGFISDSTVFLMCTRTGCNACSFCVGIVIHGFFGGVTYYGRCVACDGEAASKHNGLVLYVGASREDELLRFQRSCVVLAFLLHACACHESNAQCANLAMIIMHVAQL
jgi:hypothetical protein